MRWIPRTAQRSIIQGIALSALAALPIHSICPLPAQAPQVAPRSRIAQPDEAAGIDRIVQTLISVFDQADILALGEVHGRRADSDLRITLVRHPDFAQKV